MPVTTSDVTISMRSENKRQVLRDGPLSNRMLPSHTMPSSGSTTTSWSVPSAGSDARKGSSGEGNAAYGVGSSNPSDVPLRNTPPKNAGLSFHACGETSASLAKRRSNICRLNDFAQIFARATFVMASPLAALEISRSSPWSSSTFSESNALASRRLRVFSGATPSSTASRLAKTTTRSSSNAAYFSPSSSTHLPLRCASFTLAQLLLNLEPHFKWTWRFANALSNARPQRKASGRCCSALWLIFKANSCSFDSASIIVNLIVQSSFTSQSTTADNGAEVAGGFLVRKSSRVLYWSNVSLPKMYNA
mmetsp:Transcript_70983/g.205519  ORF Transcript_70983/g.205519 Transcript_70983/m.205519 type:complete len:306 (-) Transcript_70983:1253-2170(-)